jgi:general secretion pathway protein C
MSAQGWLADLKTAEGLQSAMSEHGPRLAVATLALLLAIQAGYLVTTQSAVTPPAAVGTDPMAGAAVQSAPQSPVQVDSIVNAHLFGEARNTTEAAAARISTAQLVLTGVLAVQNPKNGLAIMGESPAAAKLYAVGAAVPGGVRLHAVYADRVLLDRGGVIEALFLPRKLAVGAPTPGVATAAQNPVQRLAALGQANGGGLLGGLVRAQAVIQGGKLSGYRIFPGGRTSVSAFTRLGLRPGDLVTGVNGAPLDDPDRASEIMQTLSSSGSATLTIKRNGQLQELNLNLETVAKDAENAAAQGAAVERRGGAFGGPLNGSSSVPGLRGNVNAPAVTEDSGTVPAAAQAPPPPVDEASDNAASEQ